MLGTTSGTNIVEFEGWFLENVLYQSYLEN